MARLTRRAAGLAAAALTGALCTAAVTVSAVAQPAQGQQFGDWVARCTIPPGSQKQVCAIVQNTVSKERRQQLLNISVSYQGENNTPTAILRVPLGIYLPSGLTVEFPGAKPIRVVLEICTPNGCVGATALSPEVLDAMKKGERGKVTLQDARRRTLNLPISLNGFTAGFASLNKG